MHKMVLQWKGHFLQFDRPILLVMCEGLELFQEVFKTALTKKKKKTKMAGTRCSLRSLSTEAIL